MLGFGGGTATEPLTGTLTNLGSNVVDSKFADTVVQFDDGVVITHGKHVFKTGFQLWRFRLNTFYSGNSGEYGAILFGGAFTGDATGDFFTGYPGATGKGVSSGGSWHQFSWRVAGYGQDDWRITPTLTLNLGLRYEANTPWVELNNRQDNLNLVTGALEYAGVDGNSRALYNSVYGLPDIQPRVGFAWSPAYWGGKTVLRGAYTISSYLEGTGTNLRLARNPPFTPTEVGATYTRRPSRRRPVRARSRRPVRRGCLLRLGQDRSARDGSAVEPDRPGRSHLHHHLPARLRRPARNAPDGSDALSAGNGHQWSSWTKPVFPGNPALIGELSTVSGTSSTGFQTYNALQAVLQKRVANGLEGQVAYTWSHCLTNNSGYYGTGVRRPRPPRRIRTIRTSTTLMPITRVATLTPRISGRLCHL